MSKQPTLSERNVIVIVSAIQFINILDFMMVMPLGPDFAEALNISPSHIGIVGGAYTAAAAVSGFVGSFFLDRFDRRIALTWALSGLVVGTLAGGFAQNLTTLILARVLAGIFGGPAASLSLAVVADVIPPERRGKAMGIVMGSFSLASVFGVPAGLELAHWGNWQTPFFALGSVGAFTAVLANRLLPDLKLHFDASGKSKPRMPIRALLTRGPVVISYLMALSIMVAAFLIIPNIATYVQINLDYPRHKMGLLYMAGGIVSFFSMRIVGVLTDKKGAIFTALIGTGIFLTVIFVGFFHYLSFLPVFVIFIFFMLGMTTRSVSFQTFTSKVPSPNERAGFLSIQSTVQHLGCAIGAFLSSHFLYETSDGKLGGIKELAIASMILASLMPIFMAMAQKRMTREN
jgi:predicted MFS family arabinose efflux permease